MLRLLALSLLVLEIFVKWATGSWLGLPKPSKIDSQNPSLSLSWSQGPIKPIIEFASVLNHTVVNE
jgi:hypothetical protein